MNQSEFYVETISLEELRDDPDRILRALSEGQSFILTDNDVPVGKIVPLDEAAPGLAITRPAKRFGDWSALGISRKQSARPLSQTLDKLREDRC